MHTAVSALISGSLTIFSKRSIGGTDISDDRAVFGTGMTGSFQYFVGHVGDQRNFLSTNLTWFKNGLIFGGTPTNNIQMVSSVECIDSV